MKAADEPEMWERLPGESLAAFKSFVVYRDMEKRSQAAVVTVTGKNRSVINEFSRRWNWVARVDAWEAHLDREAAQELARARRDQVRRMAKLAGAGESVAAGQLIVGRNTPITDAVAMRLLEWATKTKMAVYGIGEADDAGPSQVTVMVDARLLPGPTSIPEEPAAGS